MRVLLVSPPALGCVLPYCSQLPADLFLRQCQPAPTAASTFADTTVAD